MLGSSRRRPLQGSHISLRKPKKTFPRGKGDRLRWMRETYTAVFMGQDTNFTLCKFAVSHGRFVNRPYNGTIYFVCSRGRLRAARLLGASRVSLRFGRSAALTTHCVVIHYRLNRRPLQRLPNIFTDSVSVSLPLGEGEDSPPVKGRCRQSRQRGTGLLDRFSGG